MLIKTPVLLLSKKSSGILVMGDNCNGSSWSKLDQSH
jgi:hypothetical protein